MSDQKQTELTNVLIYLATLATLFSLLFLFAFVLIADYQTKIEKIQTNIVEAIQEGVETPIDPWGTPYKLEPDKIWSAGPDKEWGTSDDSVFKREK